MLYIAPDARYSDGASTNTLIDDSLHLKCWRYEEVVGERAVDVSAFSLPSSVAATKVGMWAVPFQGKIIIPETYKGDLPLQSMRPICKKCTFSFVLERSGYRACAMCQSWNGQSYANEQMLKVLESGNIIGDRFSVNQSYNFEGSKYPDIKVNDKVCSSCIDLLVKKGDCTKIITKEYDHSAEEISVEDESEANEKQKQAPGEEKEDQVDADNNNYNKRQPNQQCTKCSKKWKDDQFPEGSDVLAWAMVRSKNTFDYGINGSFKLINPQTFGIADEKLQDALVCNGCLSTMSYEPLINIECDVCHKTFGNNDCEAGDGCAARVYDDHISGGYGSKHDSFGHDDDIPFTNYERPAWLAYKSMICDGCIDSLLERGICQPAESTKRHLNASEDERKMMSKMHVRILSKMPKGR